MVAHDFAKGFQGPRVGTQSVFEAFCWGQKTYMNNIPTIVPKTEKKKELKERVTSKSRNREFVPKCQKKPLNQNGTLSQAEVQGATLDQQWIKLNADDGGSQRIRDFEQGADDDIDGQRQPMKSEVDNLSARIVELEHENLCLKDKVQRLSEVDNKQSNSFSLEYVKSNRHSDFILDLQIMKPSK